MNTQYQSLTSYTVKLFHFISYLQTHRLISQLACALPFELVVYIAVCCVGTFLWLALSGHGRQKSCDCRYATTAA